jgi:hypothetical protein
MAFDIPPDFSPYLHERGANPPTSRVFGDGIVPSPDIQQAGLFTGKNIAIAIVIGVILVFLFKGKSLLKLSKS